ncbi:8730_t:CDS:2 [Dentiscutata erythropus]|uniref:8730_t:CDS:1 n=1 Tax=Dentiscutata erythropus TaxID=1348616 RepID=A0A9N9B6Y0_9GLOM|nr:8730_t:CDS:2 [Dentiscutata erythropus]
MYKLNQINTKHPISKFQESLWFEYCNDPKSYNYNGINIIDVDKSRSTREAVFAANNLMSRYGILRSTFHDKDDDGKPTRCYRREYPMEHAKNVVHLMMTPVDIDELVKMPFKLEKSYPVRFYVIVDPVKSDYKICLIGHHIVIDGISSYSLVLDFYKLLFGESLPILNGITYDGFISQHEEWLNSNDFRLKQKFWCDQIKSTKNVEWPMQLPSVQHSLHDKQNAHQYQVFHNNAEELRALGYKFNVTWFITMFSAVWITLSSFIDLKNANIWLPFSARSMPINCDKNALSRLVGNFANVMPVHLNIDASNSIDLRSTIQQVAKLIFTAKQNEMYPFIDLARYAQQTLKRQLIQQIIITKTPKMPMNCQVKAVRSDVELWFDFSEQSNSMIIITLIKLKSKSENDLSVPQSFPTIQELFQQQAKKLPNQLALYMGELGLSMTYEQLDKKSNQIARYLFQIGVKIETLVAIHLNQDMYMIPWILGILKAGGAYVPIDKAYPAERKNYIIKNSKISYFITDEECNNWVENFSGKTIQSNTMDVIKQSDSTVESVCHGENLCYVMYTSGSTGKPKGVLVEHKSITSLLMDPKYEHFRYKNGGIRVLQALSMAFDASLLGWAMAITNGSTICFAKNPNLLVGNYLLDVIKCNEIEAMNIVPTILATMSPNNCSPTLKYLEVGGEVLPNNLANIWKNRLKKFFNTYGPTEGSVMVTNYDIITEQNLVTMGSAIGTPRDHTSIYICDPITQELVSDKGEILIGGVGLARGYLRQDDINKERFIFHPKLQKRLYRTGDQGCILEDGKVIYLGRFDRQVKLRGLRIELSEVETIILSKCPEICYVSVQVNEEKKSLVAFVMPKNLDHKEIRNKLIKTMAKFQIPDIIPVDNLPCIDNGKIDHAKVKNIMPKLLKKAIESVTQYKNSKVSLVSHLQAIWQKILVLKEKPDINTNFFDLGGHSLLLLQSQKEIQQQISPVDLVDLFQNPTIESLANHLIPTDQSLDLDNSIRTSNNDQVITANEIAIISMVGCFPGAESVNELWEMIKTGQHGIHTFSDKELDKMNTKNSNDPHYVPKCGVLSNIDKFDAEFFKINHQEAISMDPQQRLLLEKSVQALDEAGINPQYEKGRIGVFVAIEKSTYKNHSYDNENDISKKYSEELNTSFGSAATRIAYHLNLKGPAFSLNSTCSSSLTALKTACNSIQCGDCDVAIVGAASIVLPQSGYIAQLDLIFSANGICRPFDHNSDGTILGNSVSVIVLKQLPNAISDRNPISAIIKSIELNNDGNNKLGYTAPSVDGQYDVIKKAIQSANLLPADINFIEAHGTATKLGDPVEIKALTKVFAEYSPTTKKHCAITSVKSNIGHCNVVAGFTGLIKTVKALEDRVIPPMAKGHFEKANPLINFSSSPFYIASELQNLNKTGTIYAGVSSFGIGGTNGHCILASYKKDNLNFENETAKNTENIRVILPFSAKSINGLNSIKKEFKNYFKGYDLSTRNLYNLCNIARTLQMGRTQYEFRDKIIATSISDALSQLEQTKSTIHVTSPKENIIFIISGQGSHSISIHRHIYKSSLLYQERFKECVKILQKYDPTVPDLISYMEKDIHDPTYDSLLIFMSSYISAEILRLVFNVQISGIVGHSLGQYVAATLAGVFPLDIALGIVLKRTQIMHKMERGSMLATNLNSKLTNNFIKVGKISLAAINEQNQCIFSGKSKDIKELAVILKTQNYKIKILNEAYGFHSHLTDSILDEFEIEISSLLNKASKQAASTIIPFISNTTGRWVNAEEVYTTKFWREHLRKTVQFESGVKTVYSTFSNPIFINVGIGINTSKLVQRILNNNITILNSFVLDKTSFEEIIGNCWCNGIEINWHNYYKHICPLMTKTQLIRLPGYSFNHTCSYWVQQSHQASLVKSNADGFVSNEIDQQPLAKYNNSSTIEGRVILCFKKTLGLNNININSNFFDCGGDSLSAISLISLLNKEFNFGLLSLKVLFNSQTPLDLANYIKEILSTNISPTINNDFNKSTSITKFNHGCETINPIYMIHPVSGSCIFYKDIISSLDNITAYGFEYPGFHDTPIEYHSVQDLSEIYLKDLLKNNQNDSYNLFGSSFGGLVAYEMGCKLVKQGKSVNIIMVDTPTAQDVKNSISVAEILHYTYSKIYNLDELIGIDNDEKALQIAIKKASTLGMKQNQVIITEDTVTAMLKRYFDVINFNIKAIRTYQLPRSEKPIPIIYFKAKIRKNLDPEFPEKAWIKIQEINGGKFDCIELDGDHISVNFNPACKNITDYIKQYFKSNY